MRVAVVLGALVREQLNLWIACAELGADITIIGADPRLLKWTEWPSELIETGNAQCVFLRPLSPATMRGQHLWLYRGLSRTVRKLKPDIVHVETEPWGGLTLQTLILRTVLRMDYSVCVHGSDSIYWHGSRLEQSARRALLRLSLPRIDAFVSRNSDGVRLASEAGLKPSSVARVIPAAVPDPAVFAPPSARLRQDLRQRFGLPIDDVVVAYVGRLVEEKGIRDLLAAMRRPETADAFMAVWGSGPLAGLVEEAFNTGQIRGRFGGVLDRGDVADALKAVDIVVVPSRSTPEWREHFGRVVLEAMFCECAVVAYKSGAIPEVTGDGGVLIEEGDVDALGAALAQLLSDKQLRLDTARRGREQALTRFHPATVAGDLIELWEGLRRT